MADDLSSDQSVLAGNDSDVDFFADLMAVNGTSDEYNVSFIGSMNLSDWIPLADDNNSWLCPPWNETEEEVGNSFTPSAFFQVIIYSLYSVVFVLALVGNMVVCAVVFTSIRKWTVTNFFIVNMAAGDILMAFFCIPFTFVPTFVLLYWPFGATMCRIVSFSQAVSVFVSAYTMVAISSDRYLAIVYPLRPRMTRKQAKVIKHDMNRRFHLVYISTLLLFLACINFQWNGYSRAGERVYFFVRNTNVYRYSTVAIAHRYLFTHSRTTSQQPSWARPCVV